MDQMMAARISEIDRSGICDPVAYSQRRVANAAFGRKRRPYCGGGQFIEVSNHSRGAPSKCIFGESIYLAARRQAGDCVSYTFRNISEIGRVGLRASLCADGFAQRQVQVRQIIKTGDDGFAQGERYEPDRQMD